MPRIPMYEVQTGLAAGQTAARVDPAMFGASGAQVARVAEFATEWAERRIQARNEADLIRAKAQASRELLNLQLEFEQDTDWRTMEDRFQQRAKDIHDRLGEGIADPNTRQVFTSSYSELFDAKRVGVHRRSWELESGQAKADLDQYLYDTARNAASAKTTAEARVHLGGAIKAIQAHQTAGYLTAEDAGKRQRVLHEQMTKATFEQWIAGHGNYASAYISLEKGQFSDPVLSELWNGLLPEERLKFKREALEMANAQHTLANRAREDQERGMKLDAEATEKALLIERDPAKRDALLWRLLKNPMASAERYEKLRDWSTTVGAGPVTDDPVTRSTRLHEALTGKITDAAVLAQDVKDGKMTFKALDELQKVIAARQDGDMREAVSYIGTVAGVPQGAIITDIAKNKAAQLQAHYTAKLYEERNKDPSAKPFDIALRLGEELKKSLAAGSAADQSAAMAGLMQLKYQSVDALMKDLAKGKIDKKDAANLIPHITTLRQQAGFPAENIGAFSEQLK